MSYTDADTGIATARSARLYQIDRSSTVVWRYTSADRPITFNGHEYQPLPISDDGIRNTGEASADTLTITLPAVTPVAQLYRGTPPSEEIFITVYDYDGGADDGEVAWIGSISSVVWTRTDTAELTCDSLSASMQREGLRLSYERACPHSVYDGECRVDKTQYATPVTITALDGAGVTIDASAIANLSIYMYGAAEWSIDGTTEMRGIDTISGARLVLLGGTDGLAVGQTITIYPGCDGTRATCNGRFDNLLNHGGFPHMPGESIYGKRLW